MPRIRSHAERANSTDHRPSVPDSRPPHSPGPNPMSRSPPMARKRTYTRTRSRRRKTPRLTLPPKKIRRQTPRTRHVRGHQGQGVNEDGVANEMVKNDTEMEVEVDEMEMRRPESEEFANWVKYKSFVVQDGNNEPVTFRIGGYGLIVPPRSKDQRFPQFIHEHWVGRILEIRSKEGDPSEVWAKVCWLWSGSDVAAENRAVDITPFGQMERLQSKLCDFVHSSCFQDVAQVVKFDEFSADPPLITDETFYVRYWFNIFKKTIEPKLSSTCLCGIPYNPDTSSTMHFCPRKKCFKAYHASCLSRNGWVSKLPPSQSTRKQNKSRLEVPPKTPKNSNLSEASRDGDKQRGKIPRALQFERTLPDSTKRDSQKPIPADFSLSFPSNSSIAQTPRLPSTKQRDRRLSSRYDLLPPSLLALARSPMVRGDTETTGLDEELGCVTGNIAFVCRARKIVERVVRGGETLEEEGEEGWMKALGLPSRGEGGKSAAIKSEEVGSEDDEGREETTEERWEGEIMRWVVEDEGLLCPSCGGVI